MKTNTHPNLPFKHRYGMRQDLGRWGIWDTQQRRWQTKPGKKTTAEINHTLNRLNAPKE